MNFHPVESSNIEALAHDGETLGVRFKSGTVYHYQNVSRKIFDTLLEAASVGRTFNELIKSKPNDYPYARAS